MLPNEHNLGGAHEINDHYIHMARKIAGAKSSVRKASAHSSPYQTRNNIQIGKRAFCRLVALPC